MCIVKFERSIKEQVRLHKLGCKVSALGFWTNLTRDIRTPPRSTLNNL
ncbi:hypothetical protein ANCCAN_29467 [Ancylostoma caninum]|uniref:Uncharacterized protein n=1 Tax=Ancylostoma caninum TaxID=29170 RepID=A0A368F1B8_ANCCA|nr:hypothetical protein ANCCAN_29467 [Ancylostoma caninum]